VQTARLHGCLRHYKFCNTTIEACNVYRNCARLPPRGHWDGQFSYNPLRGRLNGDAYIWTSWT